MFDLTGKVAIVTGASRGLGQAMAEGLAQQGAAIAIFDIVDGTETAHQLQEHGVPARYYDVDVTSEEGIQSAVAAVEDHFGCISVLINNAGVYYETPLTETTREDWARLMSINLEGCFLMAKHTAPRMNPGSRIINIASVAGHHAFAASAAYNTSKAGIIQLTRTMAFELAAQGINVNCICPGLFATAMTEDLSRQDSFKQMLQNSVPLGRAGRPEELAGLAVYLAADESSYMTGAIIDIDGGWTCHL
jgi:NAD(P)-dependent dehydrogenase (short-subunit alcohol dehydrogenase family)